MRRQSFKPPERSDKEAFLRCNLRDDCLWPEAALIGVLHHLWSAGRRNLPQAIETGPLGLPSFCGASRDDRTTRPIEVKSASSHLTSGQSRSVSMSSAPHTNVISDDGLRYPRGKPPGGAFLSPARPGFMSCFKCGGFRPLAELASKRILGANHKVCKAGSKR